jgi:3-methyladenine DNA glycosylase AlkD
MGKTHKNWPKEIIQTFEKMLVNKSWWDSVDFINSELLGRYFKKYPEKIRPVTEGWMASNHIWLQRSCLIFQLNYKKQTDTGLLSEYILRLNDSNEFFIQKAIGWALRQYARTDAAWVKDFVEKTPLKPLSKREALKHIA